MEREFQDDVFDDDIPGFGNSFVGVGDRVKPDGSIKESTKYARAITFTLKKANVTFNAASKSKKGAKVLKSPSKEKRNRPETGEATGSA